MLAFALAAWPIGALAAAALPGPVESMPSIRDCEIAYRVYTPVQPLRDAPAAIIAHGILRSGDYMRGWAEAIASTGITTVTVDLCASRSGDGRQSDNAADLVALRRALRFRDIVYVGVSAGGLAALIAASRDPGATRGVLLLDPVNAGGQARAAAARIAAPVAALVARPQVCNAWRNIDRALETLRDVTIVPMGRVSHCDFEWPSDRFCRSVCIALRTEDSQRAESRIRRAALGFLRAVARRDDSALAEWKSSLADIVEPSLSPLDDSGNAGVSLPTVR